MKIEVIKYNSMYDFKVMIDDKLVTDTSIRSLVDGGMVYGHAVISYIILKNKFNADLVYQGGSLFTTDISFTLNGKLHKIELSTRDHCPEHWVHFRNVLVKHCKIVEDYITSIPTPIVTFEV